MLGQQGHVSGTLPEEVLLLRKFFGEGVRFNMTGGMVAASIFNASLQTPWLHLC